MARKYYLQNKIIKGFPRQSARSGHRCKSSSQSGLRAFRSAPNQNSQQPVLSFQGIPDFLASYFLHPYAFFKKYPENQPIIKIYVMTKASYRTTKAPHNTDKRSSPHDNFTSPNDN
jgi:hypothetical protein